MGTVFTLQMNNALLRTKLRLPKMVKVVHREDVVVAIRARSLNKATAW